MPLFSSVKAKLGLSFTRSEMSPSASREPPYESSASSSSAAPAPSSKSGPGFKVPPPAYTSSAPQPLTTSSASLDDDRYAFLSKFDTIFLVDDSSSMAGQRWEEAQAALASITSICTEHDKDGIDLYFLNHKSGARATADRAADGYYNVSDPQVVDNLFRTISPYGWTNTGERISSILTPYIEKLSRTRDFSSVKPINLIVITDGRPSDDPEADIVLHAKRLDRLNAPLYQVGIQFFQIGNDKEATEALRNLDDGLSSGGMRDMVDTTSFDARDQFGNKALTADGILKVVLGAVVRRLDRQATGGS